MIADGLAINGLASNHAGLEARQAFEFTPLRRLDRRAAMTAIAFLVLVGAVATPLASVKLLPVPGYMTAFGSAMIIINILLSSLLFSKGAIEGRGNAARLGIAYLFIAAIFIPLVASFPGAIMPTPLIGSAISSVWLWSFWHAGFGVCIIRYAWFAARPDERPVRLRFDVAAVIVAVAVLTMISTGLLQYLPSVLSDGHTLFSGVSGLLPVFILLVLAVALGMVCRLGARTPEELWLIVALVAALFDVWLTYCGSERFSIGWYLAKCGSLVTSLAVLITSLHEVTQLYRRAAEANATLTNLAQRDGLTALCNRRHLDQVIQVECRRSRRDVRPLSLLMIDVDHFKKFNDFYGHMEGDACLRRVAHILQGCADRPGDTSARYGGEEFVLLLPNTNEAGAMATAERLQGELRALALPHARSPLGCVTISIGVATMTATSDAAAAELLRKADRGLYQAKGRGRNQIGLANETVLPTDNHPLETHEMLPWLWAQSASQAAAA